MKKIKLIQLLPILLLTALFLSAFGYTFGHPNDVTTSVQAQETATVGATEPPVSTPVLNTPVSSTVIVPVTGDNTSANNTTLLVYVLIGIAGLAFLVAVVAVLTRANQPPSDHTHTR